MPLSYLADGELIAEVQRYRERIEESSRSEQRSQGHLKAKKAKASAPDANAYQLNVNKALDKEHEGKTFSEIIKLPPSASQGLGHRFSRRRRETSPHYLSIADHCRC